MIVYPVIDIDPHSGFCFGVTAAIKKAEEELESGAALYCLGDIVHNSAEIKRLSDKGLRTINHEELKNLRNVRVLLRAHGEPPATYLQAGLRNITIVDATCPVVLKLQQRIKKDYDDAKLSGRTLQIVIYGQKGHAEVNGLVGQTEGTAIVIERVEQLDCLDFKGDIALYSQTTKSLEGFNEIISHISQRIDPGANFKYFDTICRQVSNRVDHLRRFAAAHDVVLFVAGEKSSNGKILYNHCKNINSRTFMVANSATLDAGWLESARHIGICGATSTPRWLMEEIAEAAKNLAQIK